MKITINYFGPIRERIGRKNEMLEIEPDCDITRLLALLADRYPELEQILPSCRVAVNEAYAGEGQIIEAGDILALIPPVAGG